MNHISKFNSKIAFVAIMFFMLPLLSCTKSEAPNKSEKLPVVKLNIVTWPGYGPIYLGKAKGFFKDEGVDVDIQIQENTQARNAALVASEIDLIGITLESVILANAKGVPQKVIGISDISNGGDGIIVRTNIKSIKDLKGKTVAFPEGQPSHLFLLYHLDKAGLTAKDIKPVFTDDAGKAGELFVAGKVDAAVTWEPWLSKATESGKGHLLVSSKGVKDILIGIFAANSNKVQANSDKLTRFFRGWYKSMDYMQNHMDESLPIMAQGFNMPVAEFKDILGGLRFIGKGEAKKLLGAEGGQGEFFEISKYEDALWRKAGSYSNTVEPASVFTGSILVGVK